MSSSILVPSETLEKTLELVIELRERNARLVAALQEIANMRYSNTSAATIAQEALQSQ